VIPNLGFYLHIPFCPQLCPYCAFTSVTGQEEYYERYIDALCCEVERLAARYPLRRLDTVFFGGGTPTKLAPEQLARILQHIESIWGFNPGIEITLEANPSTADADKFGAFRSLGCNRLSIGVQSFDDSTLKALGRVHSAAEAEQAYTVGRQSGFENISLDLIFAVPGMAPKKWHETLDRAIALAPEHISTYALTIETGTEFARRVERGRMTVLPEDDEADAYEKAIDALTGAGYEQYEVSNFALQGHYSRHNWSYWNGSHYYGIGLSAHSFDGTRRFWNRRDLHGYMTALEAGQSPCEGEERLDALTRRRERIWMGLRTRAGAVLEEAEWAYLVDDESYRAWQDAGYLKVAGSRLQLTRRGMLLADTLGVELVEHIEKAIEDEPITGGISIGMGTP